MTEPAPSSAILDRTRARTSRRSPSETWDVVIVGGGIVGPGALLDAASRGMRAALIEQDDIAAGTSSRSSRLIHGGLRYLEQFRFGLVREALAERSPAAAARAAPRPHRAAALPDLRHPVPVEGVLRRRPDAVRHPRRPPRRRLASTALEGGHARAGADPAPGGPARRPRLPRRGRGRRPLHAGRGSDRDGRRRRGGHPGPRDRAFGPTRAAACWTRCLATDLLTGTDLEIRTQAVVDATGVWAAEADHPFGGGSMRILPSRGAHLVVPRERIPNKTGLTIRVPGKIVFLVPWPDHWLIGTTDAPFEGPAEHPAADGWEVDHLLDTVNATMDVDLTRADVVGTYAGPAAAHRPVGRLDRQGVARAPGHGRVERGRPHRRRQVHDLPGHGARRHRCRPRAARRKARPSRTARLATGRRGRCRRPGPDRRGAHDDPRDRRPRRRTSRSGWSPGTGPRRRASSRSGADLGLLRPLVPDRVFLEAEVAWAVRHESALSLDDVLARRTRLAQELPDRGAAIAPRVAAIMGAELGWGETRQAREVEAYLATARREFSVDQTGP